MKPILIALALAAAGATAWFVLSADTPEAPVAAQPTPATKARRGKPAPSHGSAGRGDRDFRPGVGTLEQRVAQLEKEVGMLRTQLAIRGRVAVSGGGGNIDSIAEDPVLDQQVRNIVEEEREQEVERQMDRRRERIDEFRAEALDELVQLASLSDDQRDGIDGLWSTEADRMLPLFTSMRSGDRGWSETRDEIRTIRKETDDAAKAMLTDSQYDSYLDKRPRGPGGRGGRGRGGGGPGGPSGQQRG